jgi:hypothetical protein
VQNPVLRAAILRVTTRKGKCKPYAGHNRYNPLRSVRTQFFSRAVTIFR